MFEFLKILIRTHNLFSLVQDTDMKVKIMLGRAVTIKMMISDDTAGLHTVEIGLGTKFQCQFLAWFSHTFHIVSSGPEYIFLKQRLVRLI